VRVRRQVYARDVVREALDDGRDREDPEQGFPEEGEVGGGRFDRRAGGVSRFDAGCARAGGEYHGDGPGYDGGFEAEALEAGAEDGGGGWRRRGRPCRSCWGCWLALDCYAFACESEGWMELT
jgi:hypothetical protein